MVFNQIDGRYEAELSVDVLEAFWGEDFVDLPAVFQRRGFCPATAAAGRRAHQTQFPQQQGQARLCRSRRCVDGR